VPDAGRWAAAGRNHRPSRARRASLLGPHGRRCRDGRPGALSELVATYHHTATRVADASIAGPAGHARTVAARLEPRRWRLEQRVELVLSRLNLPPKDGQHVVRRPAARVLLARALATPNRSVAARRADQPSRPRRDRRGSGFLASIRARGSS
jgi:hypothetical protein